MLLILFFILFQFQLKLPLLDYWMLLARSNYYTVLFISRLQLHLEFTKVILKLKVSKDDRLL